jgi:hypothetical protein
MRYRENTKLDDFLRILALGAPLPFYAFV